MCVGRTPKAPEPVGRPSPAPRPLDIKTLAARDAQGAAEKKKKGLASQMMRDRPLDQPLGSGSPSATSNNNLLGM